MVADNVSIPAPMMKGAVPQRTFLMLRAELELVKSIMEVVITCVVNTGEPSAAMVLMAIAEVRLKR
ncbi:hypothetical protein ACUYFE_03120 [Olegusella massiliensis]|uniref:hypothetical protein n=1 Tax=Olegusella massiliensis TaxID=1776381 RepID=UPI00405574DE